MTDWPPGPPDRVQHSWRCTRRGALVEAVKQDVLGHGHVVSRCVECDGDDMADRLQHEREPT